MSARVALVYAKRKLELRKTRRFESIVSRLDHGSSKTRSDSENGFLGTPVEVVSLGIKERGKELEEVVVKVSGTAWYVGAETFQSRSRNWRSFEKFLGS